jgi:hypothetical protein
MTIDELPASLPLHLGSRATQFLHLSIESVVGGLDRFPSAVGLAGLLSPSIGRAKARAGCFTFYLLNIYIGL